MKKLLFILMLCLGSLFASTEEGVKRRKIEDIFSLVSVRDGSLEELSSYIESATDSVHRVTQHGVTPLHLAARNGLLGACQLLIKHGASIKAKDSQGFTAFLSAAIEGHTAICRYLLMVDPTVIQDVTYRGMTGLMCAASRNQEATCAFLLEQGISSEAQCRDGRTALIVALIKGNTAIGELLIDRCPSLVEVTDNDDRTPLIWAASYGNVDFCRLLIAAGAEINAKDSEGTTALMHAAIEGHSPVIILLLKAGADLSLRDVSKDTALTLACQSLRADSCRALIDNVTFLPPEPEVEEVESSRKRLKSALLSFKRMNVVSKDIGLYILQSSLALRKDLAIVCISLLHKCKTDMIPGLYRSILVDAIEEATLQKLEPLLREAQLYAHTDEFYEILGAMSR